MSPYRPSFDLRALTGFLLAGVILLGGCASPGRLLKTADELETEGRYKEAADVYERIVRAHPNDDDARVHLHRTGRQVLGDFLAHFEARAATAEPYEAYQAFQEAEAYRTRLAELGVTLTYAPAIEQAYERVVDTLAATHYTDGLRLLHAGQPELGLAAFEKVLHYRSTYRDTRQRIQSLQSPVPPAPDPPTITSKARPDPDLPASAEPPVPEPETPIAAEAPTARNEPATTSEPEPPPAERSLPAPHGRILDVQGRYLELEQVGALKLEAGSYIAVMDAAGVQVARGRVLSVFGDQATAVLAEPPKTRWPAAGDRVALDQ